MSWHSDNEMVNLRDVIETLCYMVDEDSDGVEEVLQLPTTNLVKCVDCVKRNTSKCRMAYGPEMKRVVFDDDFCSYGEREGE